jgi:hypothetical protein
MMKLKYCPPAIMLLISLITLPAFSNEMQVTESALGSLGLGDMQVMSDDQGMAVRGMGGNVMVCSLSIVTGFLIDPSTNNFVGSTDAHSAMANAENAGRNAPSSAFTEHLSLMGLELVIRTNGSPFSSGILIGSAGGSAFGWAN